MDISKSLGNKREYLFEADRYRYKIAEIKTGGYQMQYYRPLSRIS